MSPSPTPESTTRPRATRLAEPDPAPQPQGSAALALASQRLGAEGQVRDARARLDAALRARDAADRARVTDPQNEILAARAREARRAVEDAELDVAAFEGAAEQVRERHGSPRTVELVEQHAELEQRASRAAIEPRRQILLARARKVAELAAALIEDVRELADEARADATRLALLERELGLDTRRQPAVDLFLLRRQAGEALVDAARRRGLDRDALLALVNP